MSTTARRLVGPLQPGAGPIVVGTVPSGKVWLVRGVWVANPSTTVVGIFKLYLAGAGAANIVLNVPSLAVSSTFSADPWWVVAAGETIQWNRTSAASLTLSIFGYELSA